jgi:hypothetical protein
MVIPMVVLPVFASPSMPLPQHLDAKNFFSGLHVPDVVSNNGTKFQVVLQFVPNQIHEKKNVQTSPKISYRKK